MKKIAFITSGGDCQALNAAMRGVAKALYENCKDVEIYGVLEGYKGLINGNVKKLKPRDFSGILTLGGTIIGTSRQPYKQIKNIEENGQDKIKAMKETYKKCGFDCLVVFGGNGSHKTANLLSKNGLNVITLPKTIDNDIYGTDITFGFQSAVNIATSAIDCIHTTAAAHNRIFIVEVMGHKVGWLTLHAGIAGGADVILIPEIPYDIKNVVDAINRRKAEGKTFSILAVAEGAISKENAALPKEELKKKRFQSPYPSVAYEIAKQLETATNQEVRVVVPGHTQRGGSPCPYDRVLATRLGARAAKMIQKGEYGYMMAVRDSSVVAVPLSEVVGKLKKVPDNYSVVEEAKEIGLCFGD